jgi:hypothetical protein
MSEFSATGSRGLASFAADAYGIAILARNMQSADRLVDVYRRAFNAETDDAERYRFEFYVRLEAFVRKALGRLASPYSAETTRALIGFAEILDDDFGRRVRECAFALAPESALP